MRAQVKRVAVVMHRWVGYLHGVQRGIAAYFVQRPEWVWTHLLPEPGQWQELSRIPVDGMIAFVESDYLDLLQSRDVPVVDISNWLAESPFPRVVPDDRAIGAMAGQFLMDLGLEHIASVGYEHAAFYQLRLRGFAEVLLRDGIEPHVWIPRLPVPAGPDLPAGMNPSIYAWLAQLPRPVGVFCANDVSANEVLEICRHAHFRVPEEICVLGVDNDELITQVSHPPLSSIALHTEKIGFEAAQLLDRMMNGAPAPREPILLPPVRVVERQSTNLLAIEDRDVLDALRHIRSNIHRHLTVRNLLEVVPVNRRTLERKFREHLGRSPLQEIRRVRLETAKQLLSGSDLSIPAVARRSGFPNPERLANVFRASTGMTPTQYRRKFRLQDL